MISQSWVESQTNPRPVPEAALLLVEEDPKFQPLREQLRLVLSKLIAERDVELVRVLYGLGGAGKTQPQEIYAKYADEAVALLHSLKIQEEDPNV